jgi:hypothetical protein
VWRGAYRYPGEHDLSIPAGIARLERHDWSLKVSHERSLDVESRQASRILPVNVNVEIAARYDFWGISMRAQTADTDPRTLFSPQDVQLGLQMGGSPFGFIPRVIGKDNKKKSEQCDEKMRKVCYLSERLTEPSNEQSTSSKHASKDRTDMKPAIVFVFAAVCAVIGLGMIAVGAHLLGIPFLVTAIFLAVLPYWLAS